MYKKVALYGLAFGSLSASMILINYLNKLYLTRSFVSAIPVLANVIIVGFGVYFLIKKIMFDPNKKPISLGKALFASLLTALIAAVCNIAAYQHIKLNKKEYFEDFRNTQIKQMDIHLSKDTSLNLSEISKKKEEATRNLDENMSTGSFARTEIQMFLSVALVITLLVYVANQKRQ
jgi:hypothetical protein